MQQQCRWASHVEDVRAHQPDGVLWYKHGYERGPLIFPAGYTPSGPFTRIGTIAQLLVAMQQALATESRLRQSLEQHDALVIEAQLGEESTTYRFSPVRASSLLLSR